ncbi:MAG: hypothetical protein U0263_39065 [Polyangiaceae bacterium]
MRGRLLIAYAVSVSASALCDRIRDSTLPPSGSNGSALCRERRAGCAERGAALVGRATLVGRAAGKRQPSGVGCTRARGTAS